MFVNPWSCDPKSNIQVMAHTEKLIPGKQLFGILRRSQIRWNQKKSTPNSTTINNTIDIQSPYPWQCLTTHHGNICDFFSYGLFRPIWRSEIHSNTLWKTRPKFDDEAVLRLRTMEPNEHKRKYIALHTVNTSEIWKMLQKIPIISFLSLFYLQAVRGIYTSQWPQRRQIFQLAKRE